MLSAASSGTPASCAGTLIDLLAEVEKAAFDRLSSGARCLSGRGCAPAATVPSSLSSILSHELRGRWMTHQRRVPTLSAHSPTRRHGRRPPTGTRPSHRSWRGGVRSTQALRGQSRTGGRQAGARGMAKEEPRGQ